MDNIHMNDDELNELAKKIADIVVRKLNSQFDFNPTNEEPVDDVIFINEFLAGRLSFQEDVEEKLVAELARLTTLLTIYEDKEEYEKAAVIQKKINRINNQLNNL
jgi:hypothetical protein|tara:strand:- start:81 stop:395 length:315 start_codon:yes stop_codon:yes gene_type:complete